MNEDRFLAIARGVMALPTATYHEHFCRRAAIDFASSRKRLTCRSDEFGNILLFYHGDATAAPLVMTAHLDHPGLVYCGHDPGGLPLFEVLGGVRPKLLSGAPVRLYQLGKGPAQRSIRGQVVDVAAVDGRLQVQVEANASRGAVGSGTFAMWDLAPFRQRGRRLHGRACDDLAGVAVGLAVLEQLCARRAPVATGLLLTRAEEIGFDGMLGAIRGPLTDRDAIYINIECSDVAAGAAIGSGPVVRVGDRQSIFDPDVVGGLDAIAAELFRSRPDFRWQRKLMDGGSCEATALMHAGLKTGAVALPLVNYHNGGKGKLMPEIVDLDDALNLVALLVAAAKHPNGPLGAHRRSQQAVDEMLEQRLAHRGIRLRDSLKP